MLAIKFTHLAKIVQRLNGALRVFARGDQRNMRKKINKIIIICQWECNLLEIIRLSLNLYLLTAFPEMPLLQNLQEKCLDTF